MEAIKAAKQKKVGKRGRHKSGGEKPSTSSSATEIDGKIIETGVNADFDSPSTSTSSQIIMRTAAVTRSTPKPLERSATPSIPSKKVNEASISDEENKTKTLKKDGLLISKGKLPLSAVASAIPSKKKTALLDAFGQPRKSPREHASTLAILSSLVQQRRKRIKEYYGVSPEKLQLSEINGTSEMTDNDEDDGYEYFDNDSYTTKDLEDLDDQQSRGSTSMRKISNRLISKQGTETNDKTITNETSNDSLALSLRKGKRRQLLENNVTTSGTPEVQDIKNEKTTKDICKDSEEWKLPKIPVDDYKDPNKMAEQLDELLSNYYLEADQELRDMEISTDETDAKDLVLVNTPKDFVEIISTVKAGPLSYRSLINSNKKTGLGVFIRGKKRRNNKTGWPSLPKKRVVPKRNKSVRKRVEDLATSNTEDDDNQSAGIEAFEGEGDRADRVDISNRLLQNKSDEFIIRSREFQPESKHSLGKPECFMSDYDDIDTEEDGEEEDDGDDEEDEEDDDETRYCAVNDNAVNNLFASSSEKTENSDIFTVSSDSLDTAESANDTTPVKNRSTKLPQRDSINHSQSDDSTSDSTSLADVNPKKKFNAPPTSILRAHLTNSLPSKMETRAKGERTISVKFNSRQSLQPVVCMKKINEKDIYRRSYKSSSISPQKAKESPTKAQSSQSAATTVNNRNSCSPRTKVSPRKLRKPRGRWYRER